MAQQLREAGFDAAALLGGYAAWRASYPVEPKMGVQPSQSREQPQVKAAN